MGRRLPKAFFGLVAVISGCAVADDATEPRLVQTVTSEEFSLHVPAGTEMLHRDLNHIREYRILDPNSGMLAEVTVSPAGDILPLQQDEVVDAENGNPRLISRHEPDGKRHVVGYIWRRYCSVPLDVSVWTTIGNVSDSPVIKEHEARRALSEAVAASLRPTPCKES